MIGHEDPEEG